MVTFSAPMQISFGSFRESNNASFFDSFFWLRSIFFFMFKVYYPMPKTMPELFIILPSLLFQLPIMET
jgi:hypothetical protein